MSSFPSIVSYRKEEDYCAFCPKMCRFSCPVSEAEGRETVTPWGKVSIVRFVREGAIPLDGEAAALFYKCVDCRRCQNFCVHDNDVSAILTAARRQAVAHGVAPPEITAYLQDSAEGFRVRSPALLERLRALAPPEAFRSEADTLFLPGCAAIKYRPDLIGQTLSLFERLGVEGITLLDGLPQCGGYPLYAAGDATQYTETAEERNRALAPYATIVSACPACTGLIGEEMPQHRVVPLVSFLLPHVERYFAEHPPSRRGAFMYHDSCFLGRGLGCYEEPRKLLALAGIEVVEFPQNRNEAECCGAGGLLPLTAPETARKIARHRLRHAGMGESQGVVTACASCSHAFAKVEEDVPILDLVTLLLAAISPPSPQ
ncbi:MAG: (Fe-S)-binding protein [Deltaproteobacteria bacterium]|nr:MAG: (Fe-S)-binding protein [Deltaproteobacteria bacterium]